jgi:alkylated DNA repair dioxygenase AlkB
MGFHADSTEELVAGTGIAIVSLGAERDLSFRSQADKHILERYLLRSGSLLYMTPELQQSWKHGVLAQEGAEGRISLTFRCLK